MIHDDAYYGAEDKIRQARATKVTVLNLAGLGLTEVPEMIGELTELTEVNFSHNNLTSFPERLGEMKQIKRLSLAHNKLALSPESVGQLQHLQSLDIAYNNLTSLPESLGELRQLFFLDLSGNQLKILPECVGQLINLQELSLRENQFVYLPVFVGRMSKLRNIDLDGNPLNPALSSVYKQGIDALRSYLRSLEKQSEPLFEAKLLLVGEGGVGKTTLLKALTGKQPQNDEMTTHGISIDVHAMYLPHPYKDDVEIQFNAWDFGGQEVYYITHQFFFSRRSIYLLVWEPRRGIQQCQVEDWLKLIRLRVGNVARVIIVSTHAQTGERIARIDKPTFLRDYGQMIVGFVEVDSLQDDLSTGEKVGIATLKTIIAQTAAELEQMGMPFNVKWKAALDALTKIGRVQPCITYSEFSAICAGYDLDELDIRTLAGLMHDLGHVVYYGDDERLKTDVVLQPEWMTKAIGFVLEDPVTAAQEGILPDSHLANIWLNHSFANEPRYEPKLYPFFLRLMEKYDVSYRLEDGISSLVAQHVPHERPTLPWSLEEEPASDMRRLAMVCMMDEAPPGLVPWMIVRTHDYAHQVDGHHLHWQKGMFLGYQEHGEAVLELRGREFHIYVQAEGYPEFFTNLLRHILQRLITDNWPGMEGRYYFAVPCKGRQNDVTCQGRFKIDALGHFRKRGLHEIPCQVCYSPQNIVKLLYGFEQEDPREQLARIENSVNVTRGEVSGLRSCLANSVMGIMKALTNEAKNGPRLFDIQQIDGNWLNAFELRYQIRFWCEAEGCQHPVLEKGMGVYEFNTPREWVEHIAPYVMLAASILKTIIPLVTPAVDVCFGLKTMEKLGISAHIELMEKCTDLMPTVETPVTGQQRKDVLSEDERFGLRALHGLLHELDPHYVNLGLYCVLVPIGDFRWLCKTHYEHYQSKIPDEIGTYTKE